MKWKSKYFEKNSKETHTNIFRSLEIKQYLEQTLRNSGFYLQNYRINLANSVIHILLLVCKIGPVKKNKYFKNLYYHNINFKQSIYTESCMDKKNILTTVKYIRNNRLQQQTSKQKLFTENDISNKILKNLKIFSKNKQNIHLIIKEINYVNSNKNVQQSLNTLYKFEKTLFFNEGKRMIIPFITYEDSPKLLGKFIATHIKTKKQQFFFLNFVKESLKLIIFQKFSNLRGIKIIIKGRINNSDRSQIYKIKIGNISIISIDSKINYAESTAYTTNGTIGIKVWTSQNKT